MLVTLEGIMIIFKLVQLLNVNSLIQVIFDINLI